LTSRSHCSEKTEAHETAFTSEAVTESQLKWLPLSFISLTGNHQITSKQFKEQIIEVNLSKADIEVITKKLIAFKIF